MAFDPLDPTTWRDDPEDFIVPSHELESISATAQADCDEEAQVRAFLGLDRWEVDEETKQEALRQVIASRQAIRDALQKLQDAEDEMVEQTLQDAEGEGPSHGCPNCGGELINPADWLSNEEEES